MPRPCERLGRNRKIEPTRISVASSQNDTGELNKEQATRACDVLRRTPLIQLSNVTIPDASAKLQSLPPEAALDVVLRFRAADAMKVNIRGITFSYDPATKLLKRGETAAAIHPGKSVDARFLIDRGIVESFWNGGESAHSVGSLHTDQGPAFAIEGSAIIEELVFYPMADIWK